MAPRYSHIAVATLSRLLLCRTRTPVVLLAVLSPGALIAKGKEQLSAPLQLSGIKLN